MSKKPCSSLLKRKANPASYKEQRVKSIKPNAVRITTDWHTAPEQPNDRQMGFHLAEVIGEIDDLAGESASNQWTAIAKALRMHGLWVSEERRGDYRSHNGR